MVPDVPSTVRLQISREAQRIREALFELEMQQYMEVRKDAFSENRVLECFILLLYLQENSKEMNQTQTSLKNDLNLTDIHSSTSSGFIRERHKNY